MTFRFSIVPDLEMTACSTTVPETRAALAIGGYTGIVFCSNMPAATPPEMLTFFGTAACTLGALLPLPNTLPITPPLLPPSPSMPATPKPELGGASFSATILMSCGIRVGAVS